MKKLFSLFAVVMMAFMSLNLGTLTVAAEEPTTYIVNYNAEKDTWYYQTGSTWDDTLYSRESYYMTLEMKDGDYVVIQANPDDNATLELDFNLGNVTILPNNACTVKAKSIQDCYVLSGAHANIECNVKNGYLYDFSVCNFFQDCENLRIDYTDESTVSVNVVGKCNSFYMLNTATNRVKYQLYNFTAALSVGKGDLKNEATEYATAPVAVTPQAPTTAGDEYDDVPKTGETAVYLYAFGVAALCFAGSYYFKKQK